MGREWQEMNALICDMCGCKLDQHRDRYVLRFQSVPTYRDARGDAYDLCMGCTEELRKRLNERNESHED